MTSDLLKWLKFTVKKVTAAFHCDVSVKWNERPLWWDRKIFIIIIFRPHRLYSVHRFGLLLQISQISFPIAVKS